MGKLSQKVLSCYIFLFSGRFTQTADKITRKLVEEEIPSHNEHKRQAKFLTDNPWTFYQVLLLRLKQNSRISACGFFNVDRSLVTSFLATTFTYWVILVQFQTMWSLFDMQVLHRHILHLICVYHCIRQKNTHFLVQNYVCLLCISHTSGRHRHKRDDVPWDKLSPHLLSSKTQLAVFTKSFSNIPQNKLSPGLLSSLRSELAILGNQSRTSMHAYHPLGGHVKSPFFFKITACTF